MGYRVSILVSRYVDEAHDYMNSGIYVDIMYPSETEAVKKPLAYDNRLLCRKIYELQKHTTRRGLYYDCPKNNKVQLPLRGFIHLSV